MKNKHSYITEIMGLLCHEILWPQYAEKICRINPHLKLHTRSGSGLATYCRYDKNKQLFTINFGRKMVASKFNQNEIGDWLTSREILHRRYFDGEISLLNVLTHTICHEFSHLIQQLKGQTYRGSIHNKHFYQILDELYLNDSASKIRQEMYSRCREKQISLEFTTLASFPADAPKLHYKKDDKISFGHANRIYHGTIRNINRKTLTVVTTDRFFRRAVWRVPYSRLIHPKHNEE